MKITNGIVSPFAALAVVLTLQACTIGIARYTGQDVPAKSEIASLRDNPIYINYQTCTPSECAPGDLFSSTYSWDSESRTFLASEYGLATKAGEPKAEERAIYVLVTREKVEEPVLGIISGVLNFVSFSLVPGYWYSVNNFNIRVEYTKLDHNIVQQNFKTEINKQEYLWLPFIFNADIIGSINGGKDDSNSPEHKAEAVKKVAGEIIRKIEGTIQTAGEVGPRNHEPLPKPTTH